MYHLQRWALEKQKLRLTSFLHLQFSFGLLQNGFDSLI